MTSKELDEWVRKIAPDIRAGGWQEGTWSLEAGLKSLVLQVAASERKRAKRIVLDPTLDCDCRGGFCEMFGCGTLQRLAAKIQVGNSSPA